MNDDGAGDGTAQSERHEVAGDKLLGKVKELVHEGNVRRIVIRNEEGKALIEVPLNVGLATAILIPVWAAIGAIAALVTRCTIEVERSSD